MRSLLLALFLPVVSLAADAILIEAANLEMKGDWQVAARSGPAWRWIEVGATPSLRPAVGAIELPSAGRWRLWTRSRDFANDRPGIRHYRVRLGRQLSTTVFGRHGSAGQDGWEWEDGGVFDLPAGPLLIVVGEEATANARCDTLVLSRDPEYHPRGPGERLGVPAAKPVRLQVRYLDSSRALAPVVTGIGPRTAGLETSEARFTFHPATAQGSPVFVTRVAVRTEAGWEPVKAEESAELYRVIFRPADHPARLGGRTHPVWDMQFAPRAEVSAGGASVVTSPSNSSDPWNAGLVYSARPNAVRAIDPRTVELSFPPMECGRLRAVWHVNEGEAAPRVTLTLETARAGEYSLGYHAAIAGPASSMDFLLLPFQVHGRRLPAEAQMVLDPRAPTPLALVNRGRASVAVVAEPAELADAWPSGASARYGLAIRNEAGEAQPMIYSPVIGTPASAHAASTKVESRFQVWAMAGEWHRTWAAVVQRLFGLHDYRRPIGGSLSDAVDNLTDLVRGGLAWDDRAKGPWNIESQNVVTQSSPLFYLSLYLLTGDESIYRRYALPSMEYLLSRRGPHFSAEKEYGSDYYRGEPLGVSSEFYSATVWGSAFQMTHGRTPVFGELCRTPDGAPRGGHSGSHMQPFEDALALYRVTGERRWLQQAIEGGDRYIAENLRKLPDRDLGDQPFVNVSFIPDWEGLLYLYTASGERRFLDASAEGARWLLTTLWVHPTVRGGERVVYPGGSFPGDAHLWYLGNRLFRQGLYEKDDGSVLFRGTLPATKLPEHRVPEWQVSNVGLGLEQPVTFAHSPPSNDEHILMNQWAPNLLRLAELTGDRMFRTAARNATIGRFLNYPGYYMIGYSDVQMKPDYPKTGPDVTSLYYHHIPSFAAYAIDYLFTDAETRTHGAVAFPSTRQNGYVWFDSRLYGHAPGRLYGERAWPWIHGTAAKVDNFNVDRILAHGEDKVYVVLLNQTDEPQKTRLKFDASVVARAATATRVRVWQDNRPAGTLAMHAGEVEIAIGPSGVAAVALDDAVVKVPAHSVVSETPLRLPESGSGLVRQPIAGSKLEALGTVISAPPFAGRDLYVFVAGACPSAKLYYRVGESAEKTETVKRYPCEFTVPVGGGDAPVHWRVEITQQEQ